MAETKAAPVQLRPFLTGTHGQETHIYDNTVTQTTGTVNLPIYNVVTDGFLRGFYLFVQCTTAGNGATVVFTEDAPWSALTNVTFQDVNQRPIIGPLSGWELKTCIKFGGYTFHDDAQDSVTYSVTAGSGATGGSFAWMLHIPIEFVKRNAIGSLTNINASAVYSVKMDLAPSTDVYSTPPTTLGSVRVRLQQESWMESNKMDPKGRPASPDPVGVDTQQYWIPQRYSNQAAGSMNLELNQIDGYVRNFLFVTEDSSTGSRVTGETNFPDPFRLKYDNVYIADRLKDVWRREVEENYGYTGARPTTVANTSAAISAGASFKDNGVFPLAYNDDFGLKNGAEQGYNYLYASTGTRITLEGTLGGASNVLVLVNYIRPAGGDILRLTGGK